MEAYKELFRHVRNEVKRQELISCFQQIWTAYGIFGRLREGEIKWNLIPNKDFLPEHLSAWNATPIHIRRLSPSPDIEAEFYARTDFDQLVDDFLNNAAQQWQPPPQTPEAEPSHQGGQETNDTQTPGAAVDPSRPSPTGQNSRREPETRSVITSPAGQQQEEPTGRPLKDTRNRAQSEQTHNEKEVRPNRTQGRISRPKKRCTRQLDHPSRRRRGSPRDGVNTEAHPHRPSLSPQPVFLQEDRSELQEGHRPKSRSKTCCRFGPRPRPDDDDNPGPSNVPSPPLERDSPFNSSFPGRHAIVPNRPDGIHPPPLGSTYNMPFPAPQTEHRLGVDRATFTLPDRPRGSPIDHYRASAAQAPAPDPRRFAHRRMGLTAAEFDTEVSREVDELLLEIDTRRRQELQESLPCIPISKDEYCRRMEASGAITSGTQLGNYEWAANLNRTRLNFEIDFTPESIALLNAYDF